MRLSLVDKSFDLSRLLHLFRMHHPPRMLRCQGDLCWGRKYINVVVEANTRRKIAEGGLPPKGLHP